MTLSLLRSANLEHRAQVMEFDERAAITDPTLLKQSLAVLALTIIGFIFAHSLGIEPATTATFGAALLLLIRALGQNAEEQAEHTHKSFAEIEWITIFFFVGLFVLVAGIEKTGALEIMAEWLIKLTQGELASTAFIILWSSAILSALVDNIPFVATMIPVIQNLGSVVGQEHLETL